jgi:protoporphyrinogen oxidase
MSDNERDPLARTLDLVPLEKYNPQDDKSKILDLDAQDDKEYARRNIKDMLEKTSTALDDLIDVAVQSQDQKVFLALSSMMKTMVDANKTLVELEKTKKEVEKLELDNEEKKNRKDGNLKITQNNLYVTTADLLKMVREQLDDKKKIENE